MRKVQPRYRPAGHVWCRAQMVASRSQALLTLPMVIRRAEPLQGLEEAVIATLACQLLETKLLQVLRFKAGEVLCPLRSHACHHAVRRKMNIKCGASTCQFDMPS